jgi:Tol biopolymer transport system component/tRNA A-37 threonylcarbamoyl transferase component Bud32
MPVYGPKRLWRRSIICASSVALRTGDRLGPYEVTGSLGAGGMGEVYRARDTRLGRNVAIKVLAPDASRSPELRARFEREARAISQLQHPNICTLHDVGSDGAIDFLVMECIEGQTLARRLAAGVPPVDETMAIASQIAGALARAHQAGVVHRDLKPGNVMLMAGGDSRRPVVKLLDFGLAGLAESSESGRDRDLAVTTTGPLTARGTVLGTLPYMAPEQIEGRAADPRSDIWAFGCILYEMLAGRRPFAGESEASLIGAILEREPAPIPEIAPTAPRGLVRLVEASLVKDPAARLQSAHDARLALGWAAGETSDVPGRSRPRPAGRWMAAAAIAGLLVGAAASAAWFAASRTAAPAAAQFAALSVNASIPLPPGDSFRPFGSNLAVSPDGRLLAYTGTDQGIRRLFVRALDSFEARLLPGTEGAETPFFSHDGTQVGFQADGQLKRIALAGGPPAKILDVSNARGAAWLPDDTIVYTPAFNEGLWRVAASGEGSPVPVTTLDTAAGERTHRFPAALPDGRTVLYVVGDTKMDSFADARVMARTVDGGTPKLILRGGVAPQYLRSGHLTYHAGAALMAVPFDPIRLETTGPAFVVAEQVAWTKGFGTAHYAVGGDGTIAFIPGGESWPRKWAEWLTREGHRERIEPLDGFFMGVRVDPGGGRLLLYEHSANDTLWLFDLGRGALSRLTFAGSYNQASWSSSGTHVISVMGYALVRLGIGGASPDVLYEDDSHKLFPDVSADGRWIAFDATRPGSSSDVMMFDVERGVARPWQAERFIETQPRFSPDGRWVAYVSDESGRFEVFLRPVNGDGGRIQISNQGGTSPVWRRDGREIYFVSPRPVPGSPEPSGDLYGVDLSNGRPDAPRLILREAWPRPTFVAPLGIPVYGYDVMPDGRFVTTQSAPSPVPSAINLIVRGRLP